MLVQLGYQMLLVTPDMAIGDILQKAPHYQWNKAIKPTQSAVWVSEQGYLQNGGRHRIATHFTNYISPLNSYD